MRGTHVFRNSKKCIKKDGQDKPGRQGRWGGAMVW